MQPPKSKLSLSRWPARIILLASVFVGSAVIAAVVSKKLRAVDTEPEVEKLPSVPTVPDVEEPPPVIVLKPGEFSSTPSLSPAGRLNDSQTGIHLPNSRTFQGVQESPMLEGLGIGTRVKLMFKVYSVAFYAEPAKLRELVSHHQDPTKQAVLDDLTTSQINKSIYFKLNRDLDPGKITAAFESVPAYVPKSEISQLSGALKNATKTLKTGDTLAFVYTPPAEGAENGTFSCNYNEKVICNIESDLLAKGIYSLYLSEKGAVSPTAKKAWSEGLKRYRTLSHKNIAGG
eukprot:GHVT01078764.1.p1 GENE.GHVT01078764.1~~GHVT01078764.1.p1  ORF type:complete len:288 (+),score=29.14 GHVT01078764.1:146-1009(+)